MTGELEPTWLTTVITWTDASADLHREVYGPWRVQEDDSHFAEIEAFMRTWHARAGDKKLVDATLYLIVSPEQFAARPET